MHRWLQLFKRSRRRPSAHEIQVERNLALVLRTGVGLASLLLLLGLALYLIHNPARLISYHVFRGEPSVYRIPSDMRQQAFQAHGRAWIQLGLLVLMLTPLARVVYLWTVFLRQRDWIYVLMVSIVLGILVIGFRSLV